MAPLSLGPGTGTAPVMGDATNRKNMLLLIQLRWIAVVGQIATITVVHFVFGITLPLLPMVATLIALVLLNVASHAWLRSAFDVTVAGLLTALLLDVAALTTQLYWSGGASNPFTFLYLLQIALATVLLDTRSTWAIVATTAACYVALAFFNTPLLLDGGWFGDPLGLYVAGTFACFALIAALLVAFLTRIMRNLRDRDARLAALRQHNAEEDHIVRMGLLASGAAHELGTPLSSVAVILGDWRRLPAIRRQPEMLQDVEEMQAAVQRCKTIVTGILVSAGETRGESAGTTRLNAFLDTLVEDWRVARSVATLHYANRFGEDLVVVSESVIRQVIFNLLDNALEASPDWQGLIAERLDDALLITVSDSGTGFTPEMLESFGKPYRSTKGRQGGGLGLFLVVNVVRKLGGTVTADNRVEGGAIVSLKLPLQSLRVGARHGGV